uniref:Uncharacterized protein n=1 Tax=Mantoniella antarctica TaxID=81844 RepID=A0A7S0XK48_9CHLO|mmetsp:Transcript_6580/g.16345  ORF Transcript_6580/g.16345 Transcript_6580/m.16345 type:complete len:245 (+) Transcript_6580:291-1025(+)
MEASEDKDAGLRMWPPPRLQSTRVKVENRRIAEGNVVLKKALQGQYKSGRESHLVKEGKGLPVDGLEMWKKRLALYDTGVENEVCVNTGVPKTLGVARCSATGLITYFSGDGHRLKPHPDCPGLYYCEEWYDDFSAMDALSQKPMMEYAKGNGWLPCRVASESWVVNRHMKLGLRLMRRMAQGESSITMDDVKAAVEASKAREKLEDSEKASVQKALDKAAAEEAAKVGLDEKEGVAMSEEVRV